MGIPRRAAHFRHISKHPINMQAPVPMAPMGVALDGPRVPERPLRLLRILLAVFFCACCVVGATEAMVETGVVKQPCDGIGPGCCIFTILASFGLNSCYSSMVTRTKLRQKFGMTPNCGMDCCMHFCCAPCAICKDYSEAKQRVQGTAPQVVMMQVPAAQTM